MTIRVFHRSDDSLTELDVATLSPDESHYAVRVRRARLGSEMEVLDGCGIVRRAVVERVDERSCVVRLGDIVPLPMPDPLELWLGMPDPTALLASITAACELAATRIVLVRCRHSHVATPAAARIERVIRAAQRQCGRPSAPEIDGPVALADALERTSSPIGAFAWEELRGGRDAGMGPETVRRLLVGPEGGLADDEAAACLARGMVAIALGPWTLRTETAVAAGLARIQATARGLPCL